MKKPNALRKAIEARNPDLKKNPDKLKLYVQDGAVSLKWGQARGYEYRYTLDIAIINYTGDLDRLVLPITDWLRDHQPEILQNHERGLRAIAFEVDIIDADTCDLSLKLSLSEAVDIETDKAGKTLARYRSEPPQFDIPLTDPVANLTRLLDGDGQLIPPDLS